ncbi:uncharacterized protein B0H18DRAFT_89867 [Fomitopsis serialis]|uniref:uncharacterized protein n=1 Tax=Fomitopsis serialis TaxID=139415 RepID=UPI002008C6D7|nr:uncharacterized protein B0H18DRAFT_89867 [Neoantrodia serialis]KAH9915758.1 hypothetical protein B0H18DRAFT_89867 [Neoantrodia serialis]
MVAQLSLIAVNLATVALESWLYGIFCVIFGASTYLLIRRGRERIQGSGPVQTTRSLWRTPMFVASCLIALSCTAHWILTVYRLFDAFITFMGGGEPIIAYADLSRKSEVAKTAFLIITVLISDAMIIHRLYIVWSYNKAIIVFPILTWGALVACGIGICWQFAHYTLGENVFETAAGRWITSDCVFSFVTNVYCSLLIAWRVWRTTVSAPAYGGPNIMGALAIIIESAAIQSVWNLFFFITYQAKSNLQFTTIDMWVPICGISLTLINLRVSLGWAHQAHISGSSGGPRMTTQVRSFESMNQSYGMRSLAVNITQEVDAEDHRFPGEKPINYRRTSKDSNVSV